MNIIYNEMKILNKINLLLHRLKIIIIIISIIYSIYIYYIVKDYYYRLILCF